MLVQSNTEQHEILIESFDRIAEKYPDNIALEIGEREIKYRDLQKQAKQFASVLQSQDEVAYAGILAHRSFTAYSGILGCLYASKAFVPLNPEFPLARTKKMIERTGIRSIIVGNECIDYLINLPEILEGNYQFIFFEKNPGIKEELKLKKNKLHFSSEYSDLPLREITTNTESPAYLLFTSGSTGEPKGVSIKNSNVCAYLNNIFGQFNFYTNDKFSQTFDLTFDLSIHDLFVCWLSGATLCIPQSESNFAWAKYIRDYQITVWFSVPSMVNMLKKLRLLKTGSLPSLRISFFCGEALYETSVLAWHNAASHSRIINFYGPTEATIAISSFEWKRGLECQSCNGIVSLGKIFPGNSWILIDEKNKEKAKNGELCLSGNQVIHSYFDNKESYNKAFIEKTNKRWYKTGDLVEVDENEILNFKGRTDQEVKISGYRVNLLEIDNLIRNTTGLQNLATVYHDPDNSGTGRIIIFIQQEVKSIEQSEILEICKKQLPAYMQPEKIIFVEKFFFNVNGKVDRKKMMQHYL